jgi:hypothetical protein
LFGSFLSALSQPVTFESPCARHDNHGERRWSVKNDAETPPTDAGAIQSVTPSDMFSWPAPDVHLTQQSERTGIEQKWFALTGRVVAIKAETDGDLHIALADAFETIFSIVFAPRTGAKHSFFAVQATERRHVPQRPAARAKIPVQMRLNETQAQPRLWIRQLTFKGCIAG